MGGSTSNFLDRIQIHNILLDLQIQTLHVFWVCLVKIHVDSFG